MEIVVAYYNCIAFEDFIQKIPESYTLSVYDKKGDYTKPCTRLENIGREGETYLHHIIEKYDSLEEYTLFIQDDTDEHITDEPDFLTQLSNRKPFHLFKTSWRKYCSPTYRTIRNGIFDANAVCSSFSDKVPTNLIQTICKEHGIDLPEEYTTETCAFFICHRDVIQKRPKEFYIRLKNWLIEKPIHGLILEHMWKIIFA
jgi:hypothetical protein